MKKPLVVNMFAAPGSGKSTMAAGLFHELKSNGINAEMTAEFAKDVTWAGRHKALEDQFYIFGKQHHKLFVLKDDVDVIVTDSPLFLGVIYSSDNYPFEFQDVIYWAFNQYNNINFVLNRVKKYNPKGRNQTEEESDELQKLILGELFNWNIPYTQVDGSKEGLQEVYEKVIASLA